MNLQGQELLDYLGLEFRDDGSDQSVEILSTDGENLFYGLDYQYLGGYDPHIKIDRLITTEATPLIADETGEYRVFLHEDMEYKTIASSVVLGAFANSSGLSSKAYFISEMVNYFLDLHPVSVNEISNNESFSTKCYPNPFFDEVTIEYEVRKAGSVNISIYNLQGQLIKTLVDQYQLPGIYSEKWNATNSVGHIVGEGSYFYKITSSEETYFGKMLLK